MLKWLLIASAFAAALAGCLVVGPGVSGGGGELLFSGEVVPSDAYQVFVVPQSDVHFRGLRFAAAAYPIEVYRVVLFYRSGAQESFTVGWRFTGGTRYRELPIRPDRDVREVRMYYRPLEDRRGDARGPDERNDRGDARGQDGRGDRNDGSRGRVTITVYGIR